MEYLYFLLYKLDFFYKFEKKQGPKVNKMVVQTVNFDPTKSSAASVKVNNKIKTVKLGQFSW